MCLVFNASSRASLDGQCFSLTWRHHYSVFMAHAQTFPNHGSDCKLYKNYKTYITGTCTQRPGVCAVMHVYKDMDYKALKWLWKWSLGYDGNVSSCYLFLTLPEVVVGAPQKSCFEVHHNVVDAHGRRLKFSTVGGQ